MSILIYTQNFNGKFKKATYELISYAAAMNEELKGSITALTIGEVSDEAVQELAKYGASKLLVAKDDKLKDFSVPAYAKIIAEAAKAESSKLVLFPNNPEGKALAPAVSIKLDASAASEVTELPSSYDPFTVKKKVYTGKAFGEVVLKSDVKLLTLTQNSYEIKENPTEITTEDFSAEIPENAYGVQPTEVMKNEGKLSVTDADIIVSAGRGLDGPDNWGMIEEMAETLGAATACSRPVSDLGWRPHEEHVGQTGKIVAPNLYFAIAISGAVQHMAGINGSKVIVAINTDDEAPVFESADYGIVGDAFEVVPKLNESLKKFLSDQ